MGVKNPLALTASDLMLSGSLCLKPGTFDNILLPDLRGLPAGVTVVKRILHWIVAETCSPCLVFFRSLFPHQVPYKDKYEYYIHGVDKMIKTLCHTALRHLMMINKRACDWCIRLSGTNILASLYLNGALKTWKARCCQVFLVFLPPCYISHLYYNPTGYLPCTCFQVSEWALWDKMGDICDVDSQLQQLPASESTHRQRVVYVLAALRVDAEHQVSLSEVPPLCHLGRIHPPGLLTSIDRHLSELRTDRQNKTQGYIRSGNLSKAAVQH